MSENGKIKIGFVIWGLGLGGAERVVMQLAAGLDRSRYEPVIICLNEPGAFASEMEQENIPVYALHKESAIDFKMLRNMYRLIRDEKIQLLHTHLWGANTWGRLVGRMAGIPVVVTEHNVDVWKKKRHQIIDRILCRITARLIAVSDEVNKFYVNWGLPADLIETIYNGVDVASLSVPIDVSELKKIYDINDDDMVIGWLGRMVPAKDLPTLFMAFHKIVESNKKVKLLLVGDGPDKDEIVALGKELGIDKSVIYAGFQKNIAQFYHLMDFVVLSSTREGHPIVALEAMAAGRSMVATRVGGVPVLVQDDKTGYLVDSKDPLAFSLALQRLLNHPEKIKQLGLAAQKLVREDYSVDSMIKSHDRVYMNALNYS